MKKLVVGLLVFAGAWCAQAVETGDPIFTMKVGNNPVETVYKSSNVNVDDALLTAINSLDANAVGRFVLLVDVPIGETSRATWGNADVKTDVTVDLNGHRLYSANSSYTDLYLIASFCNLTFADSASCGRINGKVVCTPDSSVTFDLSLTTVVQGGVEYLSAGRRSGDSEIIIKGGKFEGTVSSGKNEEWTRTTKLTGGFFNKSKNGSITSYDSNTMKCVDNGDGYWRVVPIGWQAVGVRVNGVDLADTPGAGWAYADGVLSLTNALAYTLSGSNTTGAVRVKVTTNANVTLSGLTLVCDSAEEDLIRFLGANATLALSGTNTVYAKSGFAAIQVGTGARLAVNGSGEFVGGRSGSFYGRGVCVYDYGMLDWNGGTLRDYYFRKSGSTAEEGAGVYVCGSGTFNMNGGRFVGNESNYGGAIFAWGTVNIYGGDIAGNTADSGAVLYSHSFASICGGNITNNVVTDKGIVYATIESAVSVYGGVMTGNSGDYLLYKQSGMIPLYGAVGTDLASVTPESGKSVVKVTDTLYAIGENVASADSKLTGGTYTFNPTNAEYAAAGLALAKGIEAQRQETSPVTYILHQKTATVTPQEIEHTTSKVYTNEVEVASPCVVNWGATVRVVYTAETNYIFAGGGTTTNVTFEVTADPMEVPEKQLPAAPIRHSGVTVNGLDVSALSGEGWEVVEAISGGYYTVRLKGHNLEYVLHGTNTEGYVRFDVTATDASLVVSNLTIGGYAGNTRAGIYMDNASSATMTLKGVNAISGGQNRPAVEVQYNATLAVGGDGSLAAFPGDGADPIGRYSGYAAGTISYSGGRFNYAVPENQLAEGFVRQTISETEGVYTFVSRIVPKLGVMVNGTDVANGSSNGWTFVDGILSLTNATDYTLSGTNTTGAVRVMVTANATVTLENLMLVDPHPTADLISFSGSGASEASLVLVGTNTVYALNWTAVNVHGYTLTVRGPGRIVGGRAADANGRGFIVWGRLRLESGTVSGYCFGENGAGVYVANSKTTAFNGDFVQEGGAVEDCRAGGVGGGVYVEPRCTFTMYGGAIRNCEAVTYNGAGGLISVPAGAAGGGESHAHAYIYGGSLEFDLAKGTPFVWNVEVHGGIANFLAGADYLKTGFLNLQTKGLYVYGKNPTANAEECLTGGTYTFDPTDAEYAAAGVSLADNRQVVVQATSPVKYQVLPIWSMVTPQDVANTSYKVYTNKVEVVGGGGEYKVAYGAEVTVEYTAAVGYVFAGNRSSVVATFVADAEEVSVPAAKLPTAPTAWSNDDCLTFLSADGFTLRTKRGSNYDQKIWDGTLWYSTNKTDWIEWSGASVSAARVDGEGDYLLYLRGNEKNTYVGLGTSTPRYVASFSISGMAVACVGNIETLRGATGDDPSPTPMATECYSDLFSDNKSLTTAPLLPVTNLTGSCYSYMFSGCTSLTNAPALPATVLTRGCYFYMFKGCTSLTMAPELPAMKVAPLCYCYMFSGCTSLLLPPALPAKEVDVTRNEGYYYSMFENCISLTALPELPSTNVNVNIYREMFKGCTSLVINETGPGVPWTLPDHGVDATGWNENMFLGTGGSFTNNPMVCKTYYVRSALPATGIKVNGADVITGAGEGWGYADGVLSLTDALTYILAGTNTVGAVCVEVTTNATVSLDGLTLTGLATNVITFVSGVTDATLTLVGDNMVYATNGCNAVSIESGARVTINGDGVLLGGKAVDVDGRGVHVTENGALIMDGCTIGGYRTTGHGGGVYIDSNGAFTMDGGAITNCAAENDGGAVYNLGAFMMNRGTICGNSATNYGCAIRSMTNSTITITGGQIVGNRGGLVGAVSIDTAYASISGGVMKGNSSVSEGTAERWRNIQAFHSLLTEITGGVFDAEPCVTNIWYDNGKVTVGSYMKVGDNWIVGTNIAYDADNKLTAGTYMFNPTDAEYAAAGVALSTNRQVVVQATSPVTYQVLPVWSTVVPQSVTNTTFKVYTNEVEVAGGGGEYKVAYGAPVKVIYTAEDGYVFADGRTMAEATFDADADVVQVPADQLPKPPFVAKVRVTQASAEDVYAASFVEAMNIATNGATVTLLGDCRDEVPKTIYLDYSFDLNGDGYALGIRPFCGITSFAVLSNRVVRMENVTIDAQNATGMLAIVSSGTLTMSNCCVTGFAMAGGTVLASRDGNVSVSDSVFTGNDMGSGPLLTFVSTTNATMAGCLLDGVVITNNICGAVVRSSNATGEPARHRFLNALIEDNGDAPALATSDGVTVLGADFLNGNPAVIGRGASLAFMDAAPAALDLYVTSAASREGEILVTNLFVEVGAAKVNVRNNGFTAWGADRNVYLLSETNFLYAAQVENIGGGGEWKAFRSFDEAFGSQSQHSPTTSVSLVHYRNVPNGNDIATQDDDLTVGAGTNLVLRTVLRECVDGTNTTWNGATTEMVTLTGALTVSGKLTVENVKIAGKVVLSGGTLDIGAGYSTNGAPVSVELAAAPESEEVAAITSSVYTGAQLLPHFSLKGDDLLFVVKEHGLSVVKVAEGDKVARVGSFGFDTFSAAVANVPTNGLVEIIARTNAQTGVWREEVKFGSDVQVVPGKVFCVKSIRATLTDSGVTVDENPTVPVTLALDGSKVTLGEGASMAFTNVAMKGTLELAGSGLLDLKDFTGTMYVRPTRTGLIATNVTDLATTLRLGTGASGTLYARGTGIWWRDGSFSATFVQTGNGVGRIEIDDYGVRSTVNVSTPVKGGQCGYHYVGPVDQTGTDTNLSFGVVWCQADTTGKEGAKITLPPAGLYAAGERYPQYKTSSGAYVAFDLKSDGGWKSVPDLPTGEKDPKTHLSKATLFIRNYAAKDVVIATFDMVATEDDAEDGMTEAYNNPDKDLRDLLGILEDINSDIAKIGLDILFIGGILTEEFVGYTVASWIDAVKGVISSLCRICADVYVNEGTKDSDYYSRSKFNDACERAMDNDWKLHVMRSTKYKACTIKTSWGNDLEIDAAACPKTEFAGLLSCIIGSVVPGDALTSAVISWASNIALEHVEDFVEGQINERVPHGMMSDDGGKAMLTIPAGVTVTLTGMDAGGLSKKELTAPVFDVSGVLKFDQADGLGKPHNDLTGFKSVSSATGVIHVRNGGKVWLVDGVTANASNAKNVYVDNGGLVLLTEGGKDSRIGISGQTGNGAVFSNNQQGWAGTTNDYAKVFSNDAKPDNCTLAIDASSGNIYWNIPPSVFYLDLNNIPHYATYDAAAADCAIAYVLRPNPAVEGVIGADSYNALFTVSVINDGMVSTPYTLKVDLTTTVSNEVQTAINAAMPSLIATATNEHPTATMSTQAGLYYGIKAAAEVGGVKGAAGDWTLGTGSAAQPVSGTRPAIDKSFYILKADILPQ